MYGSSFKKTTKKTIPTTVQPNSTDMSVEKKRRDNEQSNQNKKITAEISKTETSFFRGKGFRGKGFRNKSFLDEHN